MGSDHAHGQELTQRLSCIDVDEGRSVDIVVVIGTTEFNPLCAGTGPNICIF